MFASPLHPLDALCQVPLSWEKEIYLLSFYLLIMADKFLTSHLSVVLQPYSAALHG